MATTAVLNLKVNTSNFAKAEKKVSRGLGNMKIKALAVAGALLGIGKAMKESVKAFAIQETAINDLAIALVKAGDNVDALLPKYTRFAAELQKQTTFGDEETISMMAYARNLGVTSDRLEEATKAAIGLSKAYRIDLKTSFQLIGRATGGETSMLKRYNIKIDNTGTAQEKFNALLKEGTKGFILAQAETKTTAGGLKIAANSWGDLTEEVGKFLVETVNLPLVLQTITKGFKTANVIFKQTITIAKQLSNIFAGSMNAAFTAVSLGIQKATLNVTGFFSDSYTKAKRFIAGVKGDVKEYEKLTKDLELDKEIRETTITDIEGESFKKLDKIFKSINDKNKKLAKDYYKEIETGQDSTIKNAIANAKRLASVTGLTPEQQAQETVDPTATQGRRTQEFSGAFEKGSVEAYKVEKSQQGNKTEREQLTVLKKIERKEAVTITNNGIN